MEGHLLMSRKELSRKSIFELVQSGRLNLVTASQHLGLSYRQTLRVYARFSSEGDAGLIHRSRGTASNHTYSVDFREEVVRRYQELYQPHDIGPTLAAEKLALDGFSIDHETLRRWLLSAGCWVLRRKHRCHRSRRERRAHFGELVQMDGSHHNWFGAEHEKSCLMNMVDDATGVTMGSLDMQETTEAAMNLLRRWIMHYGIPVALYTDRKNVYITERAPTLEEELAGEQPLTAFGKACHKLGIAIIAAHSPQAKGRVERSNGTYQDRFVKELSLNNITTLAKANKLLHNDFIDSLNARFSVAPASETDYHRPLFKGLDLEEVFCHEVHRVVSNDWVVRHDNSLYQILNANKPLPRPKDRILVRTHMDGRIRLLFRGKALAYTIISPGQLQIAKQAQTLSEVAKVKSQKDASKKPLKKWRANCERQIAKHEEIA